MKLCIPILKYHLVFMPNINTNHAITYTNSAIQRSNNRAWPIINFFTLPWIYTLNKGEFELSASFYLGFFKNYPCTQNGKGSWGVLGFNGFVTSLLEDFLTVKLRKPWSPEVFLECYCVEGNLKPIRYEKN